MNIGAVGDEYTFMNNTLNAEGLLASAFYMKLQQCWSKVSRELFVWKVILVLAVCVWVIESWIESWNLEVSVF